MILHMPTGDHVVRLRPYPRRVAVACRAGSNSKHEVATSEEPRSSDGPSCFAALLEVRPGAVHPTETHAGHAPPRDEVPAC